MAVKIDRSALMRKFHALLRETDMVKFRQSIIEGYGVDRGRDLTDEDLQHAVNKLSDMKAVEVDVKKRKLRSIVLSTLQKLGIYQNNHDWAQVNGYLLQPKIAGKMLFELTEVEMDALILKLHSILSKQELKKDEIKRFAANN